jgi:hypothetical protein
MKSELMKGELMEEKLKNYFIEQGYFVTRGAKYKYDGVDVTDIDLLLYNKTLAGVRERIIVDIKNKKTPQAIERIFWTKGLAAALRTQGIVATTERKETVKKFGKQNGVIVLDGSFLGGLPPLPYSKLSEDEFIDTIRSENNNDVKLKDEWFYRYETIKEVLLTGLDFSNLNFLLSQVGYFAEQIIINPVRRYEACRLLYLSISHSLLYFDFLLRDFSYSSTEERSIRIGDGLKFGNLGRIGIEKTLDIITKISRQSYSSIKRDFYSIYESIPVEVLKEYFSKKENIEKSFEQAKQFLSYAYERNFITPNILPTESKGIVLMLLDYTNIDRSKFMECFV